MLTQGGRLQQENTAERPSMAAGFALPVMKSRSRAMRLPNRHHLQMGALQLNFQRDRMFTVLGPRVVAAYHASGETTLLLLCLRKRNLPV